MVNLSQDRAFIPPRSLSQTPPSSLRLEKSEFTARIVFFAIMTIAIGGTALLTLVWPAAYWSMLIIAPIFALGVYDMFQRKKTVLRIFPVIGHIRYLFTVRRLAANIAPLFISAQKRKTIRARLAQFSMSITMAMNG